MNKIRLSIVTVTKDDATGLARTLTSAVPLRVAGAEHLVIDGGASPEMIGGTAGRGHEGVIFIARPPRGIADAFNAGVSAAQGEWIWFLNGGDAVHETLDAAWLLALLTGTRADVVTGAVQYDGDGAPRAIPSLATQWPMLTCWLAHPATIIRRDKLVVIGGFDSSLRIAMDYDLWQRLLLDSVVDVISMPFARFDVNGLSQRRETHRLVCREEASVLLSHGGKLAAAVFRPVGNFLRRMTWALAHWRPREKGMKHERD